MVEYWFVRPNVVGSSPINPVWDVGIHMVAGGSSIGRVSLWERMVVGSNPALLIFKYIYMIRRPFYFYVIFIVLV